MTLSNTVTLIGNLGTDFVVKNFGSGRSLAKASIATSESYKNKEGENVQKTQWHNLIVWGKKAEVIAKHTQKGSYLAVMGKIEYDQYEDSDGNKRKATQIIVSEFKFLDKKGETTTTPF